MKLLLICEKLGSSVVKNLKVGKRKEKSDVFH